ncbi:MAG: ribokinase [Proteobacteria bacterium]|nr:ribokinase [Pseudomonadota bacterium]
MGADAIRPVLVVGSANVDVSVTTPSLPRPGETAIGDSSVISVGGKGANQAVAAAACGAPTQFAGAVGDDAFGRMVREALGARGIDTGALAVHPGAATGLAAIYVDHAGQNCIVVVPGANGRLAPAALEALRPRIAAAAVVVLQCEVPLETVYRTAELAAAAGTPVILNPAPAPGLDLARLGRTVTCLVPNETEAAQLAGRPASTAAEAEACAHALRARGPECVIVTRGAQGCLVADAAGTRHYAAPSVHAVDTTGAGDAFVGCLAAALAAGRPLDEAVRRAVLYAALSTTRRGAQVSYPGRAEYDAAWRDAGTGG